MKKIISVITVLMLTAIFAVTADAQVKKTTPAAKALQAQAASGTTVKKSGMSISPKITFMSGDFSGLSIGVESYFFPVESVKGLELGAEGNYKLSSNNVGWIQIGGIGRFAIPMESQTFSPYVGGGLNYNFYQLNVSGAGSASGIGFKIFGGADFPVAGVGLLYGNVGYANNSFNYSVTIGGFPFSVSANGGGLYLEGGMRIPM
ncbi:MAG: hypothetical protein WCW67_06380 [Candidatus Margulisiibacteriota bacterium]|jgi:hypothetical protein